MAIKESAEARKVEVKEIKVPATRYLAIDSGMENLIKLVRKYNKMEEEFKIKGKEIEYPPHIAILPPIVEENIYKTIGGRGEFLPYVPAYVVVYMRKKREIPTEIGLEKLISEIDNINALTITKDKVDERKCIYLYRETRFDGVPKTRSLIEICTLNEKDLSVIERDNLEGILSYRVCTTNKPEECKLEIIDPKKLLDSKEKLYNSIEDVAKTIIDEKKDPLENEEVSKKVLDLLDLLETISNRGITNQPLVELYTIPLNATVAFSHKHIKEVKEEIRKLN